MKDELSVDCKLDANENPYTLPLKIREEIENGIKGFQFNRYPDSKAKKLKKKIANYTGLDSKNLLIGNGSDELLLMIMTKFVAPDKKAVLVNPTFGMYEFYANMVGKGSYDLNLNKDFSIDWNKLAKYSKKDDTAITVLCSPNNPTGNLLDFNKLENFIKNTDNYVLLDEAYYEFCGKTLIDLVKKYNNLIVTRTFSKAFGIAGLRIGYLAADSKVIDKIKTVKSIYNADRFSQKIATLVLDEIDEFKKIWKTIRKNRKEIYKQLSETDKVRPYKSEANFILFNTEVPEKEVYFALADRGIQIRFLENLEILGDSLRVTVGTEIQNEKFIYNLKEILDKN
ncbi:MAG: histidinol-phosphate transaminase [Bacillota bacterium]